MPPGAPSTLQVEHLSKDYPTAAGPLTVLRDVNLTLQRGEALAVMGPSGSGKSTLLHILGTLDQPTSGTVRIASQDPFALREKQLADFRNRHIGFIFQDHHLLPQCSVLENVLIPTLVRRTPEVGAASRAAQDDSRRESSGPARLAGPTAGGAIPVRAWAEELLKRVGLAHRLNHRPAELSGGERQRVAVARSLIQRPLLLLADEPTGNLDRSLAHEIGKLLLDLHQQEQNILIVVTHSQELASRFPRILEMDAGTLVSATGGR